MNDEYYMKWILLESEIIHNQEILETKENTKIINELENSIKYYKQYLEDINFLTCEWNTDKEKIEKQLKIDTNKLKYFIDCRNLILNDLRKSKNYGLSDIVYLP